MEAASNIIKIIALVLNSFFLKNTVITIIPIKFSYNLNADNLLKHSGIIAIIKPIISIL